MRRIAFALAFAAAWFAPSVAGAFMCPQTTNVVGTVSQTVRMGNAVDIVLEKYFAYDLRELGAKSSDAVSLDSYIAIVRRYAEHKGSLPGASVPAGGGRPGVVSLSSAAFDATLPQKGEIIINGPPRFAGCRFGFVGIFTPDGRIRYAVNDDPQASSYTLGELAISGRMGKKTTCRGNLCAAKVEFLLGGSAFKLKPGETFSPKEGPIAQVALLDAWFPKDQEMAPGGSWHVRYVMSFKQE